MRSYTHYIDKWLNEAIAVRPDQGYREPAYKAPLKDSDVVRVYHGFYDAHHAIQFCKYGASGKELAHRVYSYEANNNPYGLFVSSDLQTAKGFSRSNLGVAVVIEFHARVKDLEAPVWPDGEPTMQGGKEMYWSGGSMKDKMQTREKGRLEKRQKTLTSFYPHLSYAKLSDRPELADTLFAGLEYQALFIGDLDPNMIRAVWVYEGNSSASYGTFKRISRKDFLLKYEKTLAAPRDYYNRDRYKEDKIYKPSEDWKGIEDFIQRFCKKNKYSPDEVRKFIEQGGPQVLLHQFDISLWPKQLKQAIHDLHLDPDKKTFIPE